MTKEKFQIEVTDEERAIAELMFLGLMINQKTDYCVFIDFSGHVDWVEIRIAKSKKKYQEKVVKGTIRINEADKPRIENMKEKMHEILATNDIDLDQLQYDIEEVYHYKF